MRRLAAILWLFPAFALAQLPFNEALENAVIMSSSAAPAWTPANLGSALVAWYDAGDAASITESGGAVSQWNDKSGHGYHLTQATGGKKPTYSATGFMGKGGIVFNGTSTTMATGLTAVPLGTDTVSVFAMAQMDTQETPRAARLVGFQGNGDGTDTTGPQSASLILLSGAADAITGYRSGFKSATGLSSGGFGVPNPSNFYRIGSVWDGTNHTTYLNGTAQTPVASTGNFASPGRLRIGSDPGESSFWKASLKEIVVLNRAPTSDERTLLDAYLQSSWTRELTVEGDSIAYGIIDTGAAVGYAYIALPNLSPRANLHNVAISGSRLHTNPEDVVYRTSNVDGQIPATGKVAGKRYIFYIAIGANDCEALDNNGQQTAWIAALESYCLARRAAGFDAIAVANILPRSDLSSDHNINRAFVNPMIATMCTNNGFTLVDFAGNPTIGPDGAEENTTYYYPDKVHLNAAGHVVAETIFRAAINGL